MIDWYFVYSLVVSTVGVLAGYYIGRQDGHAEGIKKGSHAISDVNKALDELVLSLQEDKKKEDGDKEEYKWNDEELLKELARDIGHVEPMTIAPGTVTGVEMPMVGIEAA